MSLSISGCMLVSVPGDVAETAIPGISPWQDGRRGGSCAASVAAVNPVSGSLPADGEASVAGVRLPAGKRTGPEGRSGRSPQSALWVTGEFADAAGAWLALRERLGGTGLVPLLLSGLRGEPGRPWESGELDPPACGALADLEVPALLRDGWDSHVPCPEEDEQETAELLAPFSRSFPGLAPAASGLASPAGLEQAVASLTGPMRIGLAVASRPADVLVGIGWQGAANYHRTAAPLTVVLRSWEDRFGAAVMHVGFDTIDLLVERPALSRQAALAVAAEHFAFCMDNIYQGAGSISAYARQLTGAVRWSFWWD